MAPKSKRVLQILEKALKETHVDELAYYDTSLKVITQSLETTQRRLDAIYVDKIDQKITQELYDRKFKEYTADMAQAEETLKHLNKGNIEYYRAGYAIHELASRAADIYNSPKAGVEEKRLLLSKVFSNLSIKDETITPNYTLAFQFLCEWVPKLNSTFEPMESGLTKALSDEMMLTHPTLLLG